METLSTKWKVAAVNVACTAMTFIKTTRNVHFLLGMMFLLRAPRRLALSLGRGGTANK